MPQLEPPPTIYFTGQTVEGVVTGGYVKWGKIEICGDSSDYVIETDRTVSLYLNEDTLMTSECQQEVCPLSFNIPAGITPGSYTLRLVSAGFETTYTIQITVPETPQP